MADRATFNLTGDLPQVGLTLLEASAGTGKTYTIAALAARFIAVGRPIQDLMLVTFTRAAASELRSRVHQRLNSSISALRQFQLTGVLPEDEVDLSLAQSTTPPQVLIERFERAVSDIDLATIATIHQYSARMLDELGLLVDHDSTSQFRQDLSQLIAQTTADMFLRCYPKKSRDGWERAQEVGKVACEEPSWRIIPTGNVDADFARQVRSEFEARKRRAGVHGYSDMVLRLRAALVNPLTKDRAAEILTRRFPIVLVDEFQDTDPDQWEIIQAAFAPTSTVVLIGDPKQAIYGFRGGDVEAYLHAAKQAREVVTLPKNYRSDPGVVAGIEQLFNGAGLGAADAQITMAHVTTHHQANRLRKDGQRLDQVVWVRKLHTDPKHTGNLLKYLYADIAQTIAELLRGGYTLDGKQGTQPVRAGDIAVLVSANWFGSALQDQLTACGIPATFTGADDVFDSLAGDDWLVVLDALATQQSSAFGRAALTSLIGQTALSLADPQADVSAQVFTQLRELGKLLVNDGVMAVFDALVTENHVYARLLTQPEGERTLTDLRHIAEALNDVQRRQRLSPKQLHAWLSQRIEQAKAKLASERVRRLETDRDTVTISTVHGAKGLEYPIVLMAQSCLRAGPGEADKIVKGHLRGERVIDLAPAQRAREYQDEQDAESLRLHYVAATRAQSLLIMWWLAAKQTPRSSLHRLLCNQGTPGQVPAPSYPTSADLQQAKRNLIRFIDALPAPLPELDTAVRVPGILSARRFTRSIDQSWVRTSYSGLTANVHGLVATSVLGPLDEDSHADLPDEPPTPQDQPKEQAQPTDGPISALAGLPGGVQFGSLVHAILERADLGAANIGDEMARQSAAVLDEFGVPDLAATSLADGLVQVVTTGLGALTDGQSLAQIGLSNRLAELEFEMPMGASGHFAKLAQLAQLFDEPALRDPSGILDGYGAELAASAAGPAALNGFLTGSIDVVVRVADQQSGQRFVILDYKTNRLPTTAEVLRPQDYNSQAMATAMRESHYPLQALLYQAALHRFLSARLDGYDPLRHLGGVGYLFVRGMVGAQTPDGGAMPCGVFTWRPNPQLAVRASQILAGGLR